MIDRMAQLADRVDKHRRLTSQTTAAEEDRDNLIRELVADGARVADLVKVTGLTRARIYQIRDRRR